MKKNRTWVRTEANQVDKVNGTVESFVKHFTVFRIFEAPPADLTGAYAYPVPWIPGDGRTETGTDSGGITFDNLGGMSTVRIHTQSGEIVKEIVHTDGTSRLVWDGRNESGEKLASGLYIFQIKSGFNEKRGKLVIIR